MVDGARAGDDELQGVLGAQHVEVGVGDAQHQPLLLGQVLRLRLGDHVVGLLELNPAVAPVEGLGEGQGQVVGVERALGRQAAHINCPEQGNGH